jgi:hypothetical protein
MLYNATHEQFRAALGDQSVLADLIVRLHSLNGHYLTELSTGLGAMAEGDLTHAVTPV